MAKSFYNHTFLRTLLENPMLPGPDNNTTMDQGVADFADDKDPKKFHVDGIGEHKRQIVRHFMSDIQGFATNLDPEAIKSSTFGEIKDNVSKIFKEIDQVNTYAGAKLDQMNNDAPAIIAMDIATDPSKKAAFEKLHSELSEFTTAVEEIEGKFATLKAKITDFIGDVGQES